MPQPDGPNVLRHSQVAVGDLSLHVVEAGNTTAPAVVFLHGWPEDWTVFESILGELGSKARAIAIDLPGIGGSETPSPDGDKRSLADVVQQLLEKLRLKDVTLVGHDIGGQIVYAALRSDTSLLARAVLMNTVIPGVDPWTEMMGDPHSWHVALHSVPDLPEALVAGRQSIYFSYFYNHFAASPDGISIPERQKLAAAYRRPEALRACFDWYRAFGQDEKDNKRAASRKELDIPVLFLLGDKERGLKLEPFVTGLRDSGLTRVRGRLIHDSGHFSPVEQPERVASILSGFMGL
jgi:pimeloyl-ACP methyl ester carboxylesterase